MPPGRVVIIEELARGSGRFFEIIASGFAGDVTVAHAVSVEETVPVPCRFHSPVLDPVAKEARSR